MIFDVIIIGGGAAGCFAAITAARLGKSVLVCERNDRLMIKLGITGKGRCNVTNNSDNENIMKNVSRNPRFLHSALNSLDSRGVMDFFEDLGVKLKTERGNRVFPKSDKAADIVSALKKELEKLDVQVNFGRVSGVEKKDDLFVVKAAAGKTFQAMNVIIATGGKSYSKTGSSGDGYNFAGGFGHTIVEQKPSLVPIVVEEDCSEIMGVSLKNVQVSLYDRLAKKPSKAIYSEMGEMLFTHFGMSGPLILSLSSHIEKAEKDRYTISVDLKPALSEEVLDNRILRDFEAVKNKQFANSLGKLLPQKLIPYIIARSGISPEKRVNVITKEERRKLVSVMKGLDFHFLDFLSLEVAVITDGGVSVKEISPKTMESKLCEGLFFAGEIIDVTGYTGGYNLQIAFSTAFLAANNLRESNFIEYEDSN